MLPESEKLWLDTFREQAAENAEYVGHPQGAHGKDMKVAAGMNGYGVGRGHP